VSERRMRDVDAERSPPLYLDKSVWF